MELKKCPYPIKGDNGTVKDCLKKGHCACDELNKIKGMTDIRDGIDKTVIEIIQDCEHLVRYGNENLTQFKHYRNINEPIMKKRPNKECSNGAIQVQIYDSSKDDYDVDIEPCPTCKGSGSIPVMREVKCPECKGQIVVYRNKPASEQPKCSTCTRNGLQFGKIKIPVTIRDVINDRS